MSRSYQFIYLTFCLLTATAVWMIAYGVALELIYKDGRILHLTVTSNPFAPFQQIWLYPNNRNLQIAALMALVPASLLSVAVGAFGLRRPTNPLGDAAFQNLATLRHGKWLRKEGLVVGRLGRHILRRQDDRHHLVVGPTRSGKGVGYVIPNALTHQGSMLVTDLKGEIYKHTAGHRKAAGHQVYLFSPGSARTHRWNPLDFVRADRGNRTIDIQNIASILIPETIGSDNAVWQGTAQQVIAGIISYVLESRHYKGRRTLGEVSSILNAGVDLQVLMKLVVETEPDLSRFTTDSFNAYISLNERAARSALLDIQKAMQPFRNERVIAATSVTEIDLASMHRKPVTVYLAPNITDVTILRPLLSLFVQQVMDLLTRQHNPDALPVYFLLDEFRQLKRMDEIMNKLPYVAGYNIKMAFIIQDLKNLDEIYGETARHSLLGNCGLQIILGANDQATADYASRALGKRTIRYYSQSRTLELMGLPRRTKVEQIRERDLMMPQEVRQMPEDRLIILVEGQRPILAEKLKYFDAEPFKGAAAYSKENQPDIPDVEFLSPRPVPAAQASYGQEHADNLDLSVMAAVAQPPQKAGPTEDIVVAKAIIQMPLPGEKILAERHQNRPNRSKAGSADGLEDDLNATAKALETAISKAAGRKSRTPSQRRSIEEIFRQTVPDPADVGLDPAQRIVSNED
ncbi:type IV secretory system conjugative DNA transfer family protein [Rhizobium tumorigenes]|uniref:Type IV secretory system conjugative DNA transfer family protein n=1 Tax=Rhizobium tumorigenes TaxID=2041385 RepID=A0AAF1KTY5_9HYPH|nr:type IV secretory system conjugative DNA transfer family protein [Rhizobium tumorigenes]WFR97795.1 type IV secretory system conjugative DNA transfer family protein [Rhizobium tumorigenes]